MRSERHTCLLQSGAILVYYNPEHTIDLKFMLAEQKERNPRAKMARAKTLGWFYETEQIKSRIVHYKKAMEYSPKARIIRVPVQTEENKFIRDSIDRSNMRLTSKAMNILAKYGVTAEEAKTAAVDAYGERITLVGKMNQISEEIKEREEQLIWLRTYQNSKPFHDHYMSLKGRKQKKYADRFDAELYRYSASESDLKKAFPKKIPTVEQLEKHIAKFRGKLENMITKYDALDQKSRELSEAMNEIEEFIRQEQSRDQQKKRRQNVLE